MSQFSPQTYPLGDVPTYGSAEAVFMREPGGKPVVNITAACGCTTWTATDAQIRVTLQAGGLPDGVIESGKNAYDTMKWVTLRFDDDTYQELFITAHIYTPAY